MFNWHYSNNGLDDLKRIEVRLPLRCRWFQSQQSTFRDPVTARSWSAANITHPTPYKFSGCAAEEGTQAPTAGDELVRGQQRKSEVALCSSCVHVKQGVTEIQPLRGQMEAQNAVQVVTGLCKQVDLGVCLQQS